MKCIVCSSETSRKVKFKSGEKPVCLDCSLIIMRSIMMNAEVIVGKVETKKRMKKFVCPSAEEIEEYARSKGHRISGEKIKDYYETDGKWVDAKGNIIRNWKQKVLAVWCKEENKISDAAKENTSDEIYICQWKGDYYIRLLNKQQLHKQIIFEQDEPITKQKTDHKGLIKVYRDGITSIEASQYNEIMKG